MQPITLVDLPRGASAQVVALHGVGPERQRMVDLGILPGTIITVEVRSPLGDPTAYRVRDTLIALRREQAQQVEVLLVQGDRS
nr:FeoA family protein [Oscillochloris trichoides]